MSGASFSIGGRMYVDSLIGPDTVTTLPEATIAVFEDQGRLAPDHRRQCCDRRGHDATTRRSA
jgi:transaldolase